MSNEDFVSLHSNSILNTIFQLFKNNLDINLYCLIL